jgi:hypothetical protein
MNAEEMRQLISSNARKLRNGYIQAIREAQSKLTVEELMQILSSSAYEDQLQPYIETISATLGDVSEQVVVDSERNAEKTVTKSNGFLWNAWSYNAIVNNRLRFVREMKNNIISVLHQVLTRGVKDSINPVEQAREFRDSIGLTRHQEQVVANYKALLYTVGTKYDATEDVVDRRLHDNRYTRTILRASREGKPLTRKQIDTMVQRYRERFIKYRSEVIARTESMRAVHQGTEAFYEKAIESGVLERDNIVKTWITAKDDRVRDSHAKMHGQQRKIGELFDSASGKIAYPGDPSAPAKETIQCRCVVVTRIVR